MIPSNLIGPVSAIASLADIKAIEAVALSKRIPFATTRDLFTQARETFGPRPALSFLFQGGIDEPPITWTYEAFFAAVTRTANALFSLSGSHKPVGIVLPNLPETHFAMWGAQLAGMVCPINPMLEPDHIAGILQEAGAEVVVTLAPFPQTDIFAKVVTAVTSVETVRHVVTVDMGRYVDGAPKAITEGMRDGVAMHDFADLIADHRADQTDFKRDMTPDMTASLFHTGGTTGLPKLARHTHRNETFLAWSIPFFTGQNTPKTILCGLPLFHVNAAIVTGLAAFAAGSHIVLATPQGYRNQTLMKNFWHIIDAYQVNSFSGVPTLYAGLLDLRDDTVDASSLELGYCGAAPMPASLLDRVRTELGIKLIEGYGLTEGTCVSTLNPLVGEQRIGSVGLRLPYQELQIADVDPDGTIAQICAVGERGSVLIRGPNVFEGYTDKAKNVGVLLADGWMNTGDLGTLDADGYLHLSGRAKDVIIRGGHNIDPAVIEDALTSHPAVSQAAGIGQPDSYAGELPVAYVTLRTGAEASAEDLITYTAATIPERAARPVRIEILDTLPLTSVGKPYKPELRARATTYALTHALQKAGVLGCTVLVQDNPKKGLSATITMPISTNASAIETTLSGFAVPFRLENKGDIS